MILQICDMGIMYAEWLHGSAKATDEFLMFRDFAERYFFNSLSLQASTRRAEGTIYFERALK